MNNEVGGKIMKIETFLEVVSELVGYTEPDLDADVDEIRYENQEKIIAIVINGVEDLINNSKYKYSTINSANKIGGRAYDVLEKLSGLIKENL